MIEKVRSMGHRSLGRLAVGTVGLLMSIGYLWGALELPRGTMQQPGPGLYPIGVGILAIGISILVVLESILTKQPDESVELPQGSQLKLVVFFFLSALVYVVLLPFLGIYVTTTLFTLVTIKVFSEWHWIKILISGLILGIGVPWFFIDILGVRLPQGSLLTGLF